MVYLDNDSRTALKADLGVFYDAITGRGAALAEAAIRPVTGTRYRRRFGRTPY
jgi:hypothetical protein